MGLTRIRAEQISDIDYKQAVRVISTSNVNLNGGAPSQVDGVFIEQNTRILVAGQSTASQNGIYYVVTEGTGSNGVWARTTDGVSGDINAGMIVMVTEGSLWADTSWKLVTDDPIDVGVTSLTFLQNTGNSFNIINVAGSANVIANGVSSSVTFTSGNNFSIVGNNAADNITFSVSDSPSFVGNVTGNYILGNGAYLTGIAASTVNANSLVGNTLSSNVTISSLTAVGTLANLSVAGNTQSGNLLTAGYVSATGNITGNYILGNGYYLTGVDFSYGNANVANYLPTFTGNLSAGNASVSGNITGNYILGNGYYLTGIASNYGNANVANYLPTFTGNFTASNVSVSGNVAGGYFIGDGSNLSGIAGSNVTGTVANATYAVSAGYAATVTANSQPNITSVGTLTSLTVTGNTQSGNLFTGGDVSATGNILTVGVVSASGNVVGNYIIGNGSTLRSIAGSNVTGTVANATYAVSAGTVTDNSQPNITSVGTLTSLTVTGNTQSGNLFTGGALSAAGNIFGNNLLIYQNANILGNLNVQGNVTFSDSNVIIIGDLYIELANNAATYADINGAGLQAGNSGTTYLTNWQYNTTANAWSTNVGISAQGNITGNYMFGNGYYLTDINAGNIVGSYGNANVANYLPTFTGNLTAGNISVSGDINTGNILTLGIVSAAGNVLANNISVTGVTTTTASASGNVTGGNILTPGYISAAGNITVASLSTVGNVTADYFYGNGINLTGLANVTFGVAPPINAVIGDIWIDSNTGIQYIYFNDVTGYIWAEMEAQTSFSSTGYANLTTNTTNTQILYNASNAIVGSNNLTFDGTTLSAQGVTVGAALQINANSITSTTNNSNVTITTTGSASYVNMTGGFSVFSYGGNRLIQTLDDTVNFYTPLLNSSDGAVDIIGSPDGNSLPTSQTGVMIHVTGQPTLPSRFYNDGVANYAAFIGRAVNGNVNVPTQMLADQVVARFGAQAYNNIGFPTISTTRIDMVTTENQTTTNAGSQINFWTTPSGSNTIAQVAFLNNQNFSVAGNVTAQNITKNTWTPNISYSTSGSATFSTAQGSYVKVGQMVFASFTLVASGSTGAGNVTLTGLPFTSDGTSTNGTLTIGRATMTTPTVIHGNVGTSTNTVAMYGYTQTNGNNPLTYGPVTATQLGTTFTLTGSVSYISAT